MNVIIYVRTNEKTSIYEQYNRCANFAKNYGYSISDKVLDFEGTKFYEAVNKVIANDNITALIVYSKEAAFDNNDDYLFYKIYCEKLNKRLLSVI